MLTERELILANLDAFVRQRSGLEYRGCSDAATFAPVFVAIEARHDGLSPGDWLRRYFRREFGRGLAGRYFN